MVALTMLAMTAATIFLVGYPLFVRRARQAAGPADSGELALRKAVIYREIKDLEFDRAMDKVSDADYAEMRLDFEADAVDVLQALEEKGNGRPRRARSDGTATREVRQACPSCGKPRAAVDAFCRACGEPLERLP